MKEIILNLLQKAVYSLKKSKQLPEDIDIPIKVERTKNKSHGDFATNLALVLAGKCSIPALDIANLLITQLKNANDIKISIAGPGFINFYLPTENKLNIIPIILKQKDAFGCTKLNNEQKIILEFVSANPTGPLHVGHGRGAAYGASLANLLKCAGFTVHCEYYVNDAGRQMDILATSVWLRYLSICKEEVVFPSNGYKGEYVKDMANALYKEYGDNYSHSWQQIVANLPMDEAEGGDKEEHINALINKAKELLGPKNFELFHSYATNTVLDGIKEDLANFGVTFDNWFSERSLHDDKSIDKAISALKDSNHTYEKDGALWFKSTQFGDEKDRVLVRSNGQYTYIAPDIAYHWHKYHRGYDKVIDIFGADHHGYITRLKASVRALGHDDNAIQVILVQFANLYRNDERISMSTRSGEFVTLRELQDEVGKDAARFFYVMRKSDQHMDFDLELAKSESNDNPVYYIQYAHARIASVLRQLEARKIELNEALGLSALDLLDSPHEIAIVEQLNRYPEVIQNAATSYEPHQIAYYLRELATNLHSYYNSVQLICENTNLRSARICLLEAIRQVLHNGLNLLGVSSPRSM